MTSSTGILLFTPAKAKSAEINAFPEPMALRMTQLRETGLGGLAGTPTGEAIKQKIFGNAEDPVNSF
jgi:hypothetical protein